MKKQLLDLKNFTQTKTASALGYKLSLDTLALILLAFVLMLIVESLLPGLVTTHLGFVPLVLSIIVLLYVAEHFAKRLNIAWQQKSHKNPLVPFILVFIFLLLGNALRALPYWENLLITTTTTVIIFWFYENLFGKRP